MMYVLPPVAFQPQCFRILFIFFSTRRTTLCDLKGDRVPEKKKRLITDGDNSVAQNAIDRATV